MSLCSPPSSMRPTMIGTPSSVAHPTSLLLLTSLFHACYYYYCYRYHQYLRHHYYYATTITTSSTTTTATTTSTTVTAITPTAVTTISTIAVTTAVSGRTIYGCLSPQALHESLKAYNLDHKEYDKAIEGQVRRRCSRSHCPYVVYGTHVCRQTL